MCANSKIYNKLLIINIEKTKGNCMKWNLSLNVMLNVLYCLWINGQDAKRLLMGGESWEKFQDPPKFSQLINCLHKDGKIFWLN